MGFAITFQRLIGFHQSLGVQAHPTNGRVAVVGDASLIGYKDVILRWYEHAHAHKP